MPRRQADGGDGPDRLGLRGRRPCRALAGLSSVLRSGSRPQPRPQPPPSLGGLAVPGAFPRSLSPPALAGRACRQRWELSLENPRAFSACPRCFPQSTSICPLDVGSFSRGVHSCGPPKLILTYAVCWRQCYFLVRIAGSQTN